MIPKLSPDSSLDPVYLSYFKAVKDGGFTGEIEYSYSSRLAMATDNSTYQLMPTGILLPVNVHDI